jgi:hypothetical protein
MGVTKSTRKKRIIRIKKNNTLKLKGVDTLKYCGTIHLKEDALSIQKKLRNEWQ